MKTRFTDRLLCGLLSLVMVLSMLPANVLALGSGAASVEDLQQDATEPTLSIVDNKPVGDVIYTEKGLALRLNTDGESYTVVDFVDVSASSVTIPDTYDGKKITRIGDSAFKDKFALRHVTLSENIAYIGDDVFSGCDMLTFNQYSNGLYLGTSENAHFYLVRATSQAITECQIHEDTKILASYAFHNCTGLTEIHIPSGIIQVGFRALRGCDNLERVTLPFAGEVEHGGANTHVGFVFGARTYGGNISFVPTTLKELVIKRGVLQKNALYGLDSIQHLGIPSLQQPLGYYYGGETYEDNIDYIPATLTSIEVVGGSLPDYAFHNCVNLENIILGDAVSDIGPASEVFYNTQFYKNTANYEDGILYSGIHLLHANPGISGDITIRAGTVHIEEKAFYECKYLTGVIIPDSVTIIGEYAFYGCSGLTNVSVGNGVKTIGYQAFSRCTALTDIFLNIGLKEIGANAFWNCSKLTSIVVPNTVTSIGYSAFSGCSGLVSITLPFVGTSKDAAVNTHFGSIFGAYSYSDNQKYVPAGLTSVELTGGNAIDTYAFYKCVGISNIKLPATIDRIGDDAFSGCTGLTDVYITNMEAWQRIVFGAGAANPLYYGANLHVDGGVVTELIIPEGTTVINDGAYRYWTGLKSVVIPDTVTYIGSNAFEGCTGLTAVIIPDSVTTIGASAFHGCNGLTSITIGKGVTDIGKSAFAGCTAVTNINFNAAAIAELSSSSSVFTNIGQNAEGVLVVIGADVTGIPNYLFDNCAGITSVSFAAGSVCASIGSYAFRNCTALTSITIPSGITSIGYEAFYECVGLTEIYFNAAAMEDLDSENGVFANAGIDAEGIAVTIGANVTKIPAYLFYRGYSNREVKITNVVFEEGSICESIGSYAFAYNTSLAEIAIPNSTTNVGRNAFFACTSLSALTLGNAITTIGAQAFDGCSSLVTVVISDSVTSIQNNAFADCAGLISLTIGKGVKDIDSNAFSGCTALKEIFFNASWMNDLSNGNSVFSRAGASSGGVTVTFGANVKRIPAYLFYSSSSYYRANIISVAFETGSTCVEIGSYAFADCYGLTSVAIPAGIVSVGEKAFYSCSTLKSVHITDLSSWCNIVFADAYANPVYYAKNLYLNGEPVTEAHFPAGTTEISGFVFYNLASLTTVTIPASVTSVGDDAFYGCSALNQVHISDLPSWLNIQFATAASNPLSVAKNLYLNWEPVTEVHFPEGTTQIGNYVFYNCTSLANVTIPDSVIKIGSYAFFGCSALNSVAIGKRVSEIGEHAFGGCDGMTAVNIADVTAWTQIVFANFGANPLYYAKNLYINGEPITQVHFPEGTTKISEYAFYNCSSLTMVTIPASVTEIGSNAFYECTALTTVNISDISAWCKIDFGNSYSNPTYYAKGLHVNGELVTQIQLPEGMTELGGYVFYNCSTLTSVAIPDGVEKISGYAFYGCSGLTSIAIPESVNSIGAYAFYKCSGLTSITIPNGITNINTYSFAECTGLRRVTIPSSVTTIASSAFSNCTKITGVYITDLAAWCKISFASYTSNPLYFGKKLYLNGTLVTQVQFPEGIKAVGKYVFYNCTSITSVQLPETVTAIGERAFSGCTGITTLNLPSGITKIDGYAFYGCAAWSGTISLENLSTVSNYSFYNCKSLTGVSLGDKVTSIGSYAFSGCSGLTSITIPESVIKLNNSAFTGCTGLQHIHYAATALSNPSSGNGIFTNAGKDSGGITVTIGANVTKIPAYLFYPSSTAANYPRITRVEFESGSVCTSIGNYAFRGCSLLESITIPATVTSIGSYAIYGCGKLTNITYSGTSAQWKKVTKGTSWDTNAGNYTVYCSDATVTKGGVVTYYDAAQVTAVVDEPTIAYGHVRLSVVTSVQSTAGDAVRNQTQALADSEGLSFVSRNNGTCFVSGIGTCTDTDIVIPSVSPSGEIVVAIGASAFYGRTELTSVSMPSSVKEIGSSAFAGCTGLVRVTIGENVTYIGQAAFDNCTALEEIYFNATAMPDFTSSSKHTMFRNAGKNSGGIAVVIGANVTNIPAYLFETDSPNIVSVTFETESACTSIGSYAFYGCAMLTEIVIPDSVSMIGQRAFSMCNRLNQVTVGRGLTKVGEEAFYSCNALTAVNIADISAWASIDFASERANPLYYARDLYIDGNLVKEVVIPKGVTNIGRYAFYNGYRITSLTIAGDIDQVGAYAFYNCSQLKSITITGTIKTINDFAFSDCDVLNGVYISDLTTWMDIVFTAATSNPLYYAEKLYLNGTLVTAVEFVEGTTTIGDYTFINCVDLEAIELPDSMLSIGERAFMGCLGLSELTIPVNVKSISDGAFSGCKNLSAIQFNATAMDDFVALETAFYEAGINTKGITVTFGANVTRIPAYLFCLSDAKIVSILFEDGCICKTIGEDAFNSVTGFTHITIPETVTEIEEGAFRGCSGLLRISIPANVAVIGDMAFSNCSNLAEVIFEKNEKGTMLRSIGSKAFAYTAIGNAEGSIQYAGDELAWRFIQKATDWDGGLTTWKNSFAFGEEIAILYEMSNDRSEFYVGEYSGISEIVVIPEYYCGRLVTQIYEKAFYNANGLLSVTVPASIQYIASNTFYNCEELLELIILGKDVVIERGMVFGCEQLEALTVPDLTGGYLGYFFGADSFKVNADFLPEALEKVTLLYAAQIPDYAFAECGNLNAVILPETVTAIGDYAFAGCSSLSGTWQLPDSLQSIGEHAFDSCKDLDGVVLPDGLVRIGDNAFADCISFAAFVFPDSVTEIGLAVLDRCNGLKTVHIGSGMQLLPDVDAGMPLFGINKASSSLTRYTVSEGNTRYAVDNFGVLYELHETLNVPVAVIDAPAKVNLKNYVLPEHIVYVGPYAFAYNSTLRWIQLDRVRRIDNNAFYGATALVAAVFGQEGVAEDISDDLRGAYNSYLQKVSQRTGAEEVYSQFIGSQAFMGCRSLQYVNLWSDHILAIDDQAFFDCDALRTIRISSSVEHIGDQALSNDLLEGIYVDPGNATYRDVDGVLYSKLDDGSYMLLIYPACKTTQDAGTGRWINGKLYQTEFALPEAFSVSYIQSYAFRGTRYLEELTLSGAADLTVGDYAFAESAVRKVSVGNNVISLGSVRGEGEYTVFTDCSYLTDIDVSEGNGYYCSRNGILFDKTMTKLIKYPQAKTGREYTVPHTVSAIATMAFKDNKQLATVTVTSDLQSVGLEAFYGCTDLSSIYFDHVYAPVTVMENAFTTSNDASGVKRAMLCYSESCYENGANGEYGWINYRGIYPLYACESAPGYEPEYIGQAYYAVVVVDANGRPLSNVQVSLTDPNGVTESILTARNSGIAMFYDLYDSEGMGFWLDFTRTYQLKVTDPSGKYFTFENAALLLDGEMYITYVTMTMEPSIYGVDLGGTDINTQTTTLNKAQFGLIYDEITLKDPSKGYTADNIVLSGGRSETVKITTVVYHDATWYVDYAQSTLYQNGAAVPGVSVVEDECVREGSYTTLVFEVSVDVLHPEVPLEARAMVTDGSSAASCGVLLNIDIIDFAISEEDVNLDTGDLDIDLSAGGDILMQLLGSDKLNVDLGENMNLSTVVDGKTVTVSLNAAFDKESSKKTGGIESDCEKGYEKNHEPHNKNTWFFQFKAIVPDDKGVLHNYTINIRFARGTEKENYYYYRLYIYEGNYDNEKVKEFGVVNAHGGRNGVKAKAYLIYFCWLNESLNNKDITKGHKYEEPVIAPVIGSSTQQSFKVELYGDIVFQYEKGKGLVPVTSQIKGTLEYTFHHEQQFMVWIIPIYLEVQVDVNGEVNIQLKYDEWRSVSIEEAKMTLSAEISAKLGVGCKVLSAGVTGTVGTVFVLEFYPQLGVESWSAKGNISAYVTYVTIKWNKGWLGIPYPTFGSEYKDSVIYAFDGYIIAPDEEETATAQAIPLGALYLAQAYGAADPEDYKEEATLFTYNDKLYKVGFVNMLGTVQGQTEGEYDTYNYLKLAISRWNTAESTWELVQIVDDNGYNDFYYTIDQTDSGIRLAYTQQTEKTNEETTIDTYDYVSNLVVKSVDISDPEVQLQVETVAESPYYKYLSTMAVVDGVKTVVWAENADNNMFGVSPDNYLDNSGKLHVFKTTANSVWMSKFVDGKWTQAECIASGLSTVMDLAIAEDGTVAYIIDTDADISGADDRVLYTLAPGSNEPEQRNSIESVSILRIHANENGVICYSQQAAGERKGETSLDYLAFDSAAGDVQLPEAAQQISGDYALLYGADGQLRAVFFDQTATWKDEFGQTMDGSQLMGIFHTETGWGEPIAIRTEALTAIPGRYISSFNAALSSDGAIMLTVEYVNSDGTVAEKVTERYEPADNVLLNAYEVDYREQLLFASLSNEGAKTTDVYYSINGGQKQLLCQLTSGETADVSIPVSGYGLTPKVEFFAGQDGQCVAAVTDIDLNYSDLRPVVKQLLLGRNNVLLVAVRNDGNFANSGTLYVRIGSHDTQSVRTEAIVRTVDLLIPGAITYYEIMLGQDLAVDENTVVTLYIAPDSAYEKGEATDNDILYTSVNSFQRSAEDADYTPETNVGSVTVDPQNREDVTIDYTFGEGGLSKVQLGDRELLAGVDYTQEESSTMGSILLGEKLLAELAPGNYTLNLAFTDGNEVAVSLKILGYFQLTWMSDGEVVLRQSVAEGTVPDSGFVPEKPAEFGYRYLFEGWDSDGDGVADKLSAVNSDTTYQAVWRAVPEDYVITWVMTDASGNTVTVQEGYYYGDMPVYLGKVFVPAGAVFSGWDANVEPVFGDKTYTAVYTALSYTITWLGADGTVLQSDSVYHGEMPAYVGETPVKTGDAQYSYTFTGWDAAIVAATQDAAYTAQFAPVVNTYTVTWIGADGAVLETDEAVPYGTAPEYNGELPVKAEDETYTYTFAGWTPETSTVTGDITYTAQFTAEEKEKPIEKFELYGANVTLGNNLDMKFAFAIDKVSDWTGHYVKIVKENADGTTREQTYYYDEGQWQKDGNYYVVVFTGIAAKEMADELTVTIYNAEGEAVSEPWVDSMRAYAMRQLNSDKNAENALLKTAIVDMLNYGAAAQKQLKYGEDDLANALLTDAQKKYATESTELTLNNYVKPNYYYASNLTLKSNIVFQIGFTGLTDDMTVEVAYTNHTGKVVNKSYLASELPKNGGIQVVKLEELVVSDARQVITITVKDASGTEVFTMQESIEEYLARRDKTDIEESFMKFSDSAHAYLHRNDK